MKNKTFTFDYHSGMIRRDFVNEGPKAISIKKSPAKNTNRGIVSTVKMLFSAN